MAYCIGGPLDGQDIPEHYGQGGILEAADRGPPVERMWDARNSTVERPFNKSCYYIAHSGHRTFWRHQSLSYTMALEKGKADGLLR